MYDVGASLGIQTYRMSPILGGGWKGGGGGGGGEVDSPMPTRPGSDNPPRAAAVNREPTLLPTGNHGPCFGNKRGIVSYTQAGNVLNEC